MKIETISGNKFYPVLAKSYMAMGCKLPIYVKNQDRLLNLSDSLTNIVVTHHVEYIYLKESDLLEYTQQLIKQNKISDSSAAAMAQLAERTQLALWALKNQGVNHQNFYLLENIAKSIVEVSSTQKVGELFSKIPAGEAQKYLIRTFLAKLLCYKLEFKSEATLYKITLSSLLCDVGLFDKDLGNKLHQERSVEILKDLKIPGDVEQIILHHHEYNDASGPLKISRHKIHPLAKIIRLTDEFTEILFEKKVNRNIILQDLYALCPRKFDQNLVRALDLCFKS